VDGMGTRNKSGKSQYQLTTYHDVIRPQARHGNNPPCQAAMCCVYYGSRNDSGPRLKVVLATLCLGTF